MEGDVSKLTIVEIGDRIRELEHRYAECFADNVDIKELHLIRVEILELKQQLPETDDDRF